MKTVVVLLLAILVALSNAAKRTDWVISPNVSPSGVKCTASPFWDYRSNLLFYLAPEDGKVYSLDPATNKTNSVDVEKNTVFIQPTEKPDCIVYGVKNQIKTLEWDGKGVKKGGDVLVTMNEVGPDAKILAGAVSLQGNLTFIVEGTKQDKKAWYVYSMKLDMPPFKQHYNALNGVSQHIDSLYWTCEQQYLYTTSTERHETEELKYYQAIGYLQLRNINIWDKTYHPLGESKESTENKTYQIMNYSNNDMAEVFQLVGRGWISDFATAPVKMLTSDAFGGSDLKTLYLTSKKTPEDQLSQAGGLFSCDSIGAIGRPAFIATSTLNPDIDYCQTPKPDLVVPMTPPEIEAKCKSILSGSVSADASAGGQAGGQAGGKASVGIKIDAKFCAKFDAQFKRQAAGGVTGKPGGGSGGMTGKPGGGGAGVTIKPGGSVSAKPGGGGGGVSGGGRGGVTGKPGGGSGGVTAKPGGGAGGVSGGGGLGVTGKPGGGSGGVTGKPGVGSGGVTGKPGGGSRGVTGKSRGGSGGVTEKPGRGSGGVTGKPGGGIGGVTGKPGGGSGRVSGGVSGGGGGGVTGSPGRGADLTASTPCYLPPTPAS